MGIGDWFKRFRSNAEALEGYREGVAEGANAPQSQADRAAHEHSAPSHDASARDENNGNSA